jgi:hypothetical protein
MSSQAIPDDRSNGNLFTPAYTQTYANEANRFTWLQNPLAPTRGVMITFKKNTNVWGIFDMVEGRLVPAYYFPFTADSISDTGANTGTLTSSNTNYIGIDTATDHKSWIVPAGAVGAETIKVVYLSHTSTGAVGEVLVDGVSVGTFVTAAGSTTVRQIATITLTTPLTLGQTIRVQRLSGETNVVRLHGIYVYDSDGTWFDGAHRILIGTTNAIFLQGSSIECAYRTAATGVATQWVGGYAHQGSGNCSQTSVNEAATLDGAGNALVVGYQEGLIDWSRGSTVTHETGSNDIATMSEHYYISGSMLRYFSKYTATEAIDASTRYVGMLPATALFTYLADASDQRIFDISDLSGAGDIDLPVGSQLVKVGVGGGTISRVCMLINPTETPIQGHFVSDQGGTSRKIYWALEGSIVNAASGTSWIGGWSFWLEPDD